MTIVLNNQVIDFNSEIQSLALYGYAVFTSFLVIKGGVKGFSDHLERLQRDCIALFAITPSESDIRSNLTQFIEQFDSRDIFVRITVFPQDFSLFHPENINQLNILVTGRTPSATSSQALRLKLIDTQRILPHHKTVNMISNFKARVIAHKAGYSDALLSMGEKITEGTTWNIFFTQDDTIFTPPVQDGLLPGVTRKLIIENTSQFDIKVQEKSILKSSLSQYESCFITNSSVGISPVESIEQITYQNSKTLEKVIKLYSHIPEENLL